jgi:hypothetical protein
MKQLASQLGWPRLAVCLLAIAAAALTGCGSAASPSTTTTSTTRIERVPQRQADAVAAGLQDRVRHGKWVPYAVNVGVELPAHRPDGTAITETTSAPLVRKIDGQEVYFKLVGYSLKKLRVVAITHPIGVTTESWDVLHRDVHVTNRGGVINTDGVQGIPAGPFHLSDGHTEFRAIASTSANP